MLLYIHIPFCDSKCFYCAFNSYTDKFHLKNEYMKSLNKQLEFEIENYVKPQGLVFDTVFIGGGTPSTIKSEMYIEIFNTFKPYLKDEAEITTEANPNSANLEWLNGMKNLGVNRVSFGVQSFNDEKLKKLGRSHKSKSAIEAIKNASIVGFKNGINCDIIYGVAGDDLNLIKSDLSTAFSLPITHLSAYSLMIEEGTKFFDNPKMKIDDEDLSYEVFDFIEENKFKQYEISNFSISKDYESKHNYGYWEHKEYLGVGSGSVGYWDKKRRYPTKVIEDYVANPFDIELEEINEDDIKVEKILLGFRCSNGVSMDLFNEEELSRVNILIEDDKLEIKQDRLYNKNFLLADELALYIID